MDQGCLAHAENWYVMDKDEESALELNHGDWEMDSPFQLGDFWGSFFSFSGVVVDVTDCTSVETLKLLDA